MKDEFKINGFSAVSEKEMLDVDGGFNPIITIAIPGPVGIIAAAVAATAATVWFIGGSCFDWW